MSIRSFSLFEPSADLLGPSTPTHIHDILALALCRQLPLSSSSDPCFSNSPHLIFPSRKECEKLRTKLNAYRTRLRRISENLKHPLREEAIWFAHRLYSLRICMRNPRHPSISHPVALYKLPDGTHHLYFTPASTDIPSSVLSIISAARQRQEEKLLQIEHAKLADDQKSVFSETLRDLGYTQPDPDFDNLIGASDALTDLGWISPSSSPAKKK